MDKPLIIENISEYSIEIKDNNLYIIPKYTVNLHVSDNINGIIDVEKPQLEVIPKNAMTFLNEDEFRKVIEQNKKYTKIQKCVITNKKGQIISISNTYSGILFDIFKNMTPKKIIENTTFNYLLNDNQGEKGFVFLPEIHMSFQRKDACNTLLEILKMVKYNKYNMNFKMKTKDGKIYQFQISKKNIIHF
jgi:hypothetical protein